MQVSRNRSVTAFTAAIALAIGIVPAALTVSMNAGAGDPEVVAVKRLFACARPPNVSPEPMVTPEGKSFAKSV